tara:strand:- start:189 stop:449 length:261 start_codon:yes stop_codon:yes gene_type:complete
MTNKQTPRQEYINLHREFFMKGQERKRYLKLVAILFANGTELTEAGVEFALASLDEERTPLDAAVDITDTQNNMCPHSPLLFVEIS